MKETPIQIFNQNITHIGFDMKEMVRMIESNEVPIGEVIKIALSQKQPQARLSCWIITHYLLKNHSGISNYLDNAIDFLPHTTHTGQTREILRWLTICKPKSSKKLGQLLDFCLGTLTDFTLPIAIKIHAMNIIDEIAKKEPEIIPEFSAIITDILPYMSAGGDNKIKKLLAKYHKQGLLV